MSANQFRFAVQTPLLVLGFIVQPAAAQPSIVSRTVVSMGGVNSPVSETTVAAHGSKLVAMWNIMQPAGQSWGHYRLGYAVSEDGGESWTDMGIFPVPSGCSTRQLDPTVVADPQGEMAGDFIGGGVADCGAQVGYVARMPVAEIEFEAAASIQWRVELPFGLHTAGAWSGPF